MDGGDSIVSSAYSKAVEYSGRSGGACKSHKEAERRRRQRINAHLSTLRSLLPNTTKTDKASLLAEVVNHVKELRRKAADVARQVDDGGGGPRWGVCTGSEPYDSSSWPFPGESDEVSLSYCDDGEAKLIKATVCCEDRPGLDREIARAIRSVRARPVRAEITTVGGRTKNVVVMQWSGGREEDSRALKRALKAVVENRASSSGLGQLASGNKRARVYGSVNEGDYELLLTNI